MEKGAIDIICTGESALAYDWSSKNQRWSVASASKHYGKDIDLYFCLHDGETVEDSKTITQDTYPLQEIITEYNSGYFACSIAYMIAYAMYKGVKKINLYGVDMSIGSEYQYERPSVLYWIGRAEGLGVKVNTTINTGNFLYGYETEKLKQILSSIDYKRQYAKGKISSTSGDEYQQWIGRLHTLSEIKNILRT